MKPLILSFALAVLWTAFPGRASAQSDPSARKKHTTDLAKRIDKIIYSSLQKAQIQPGAKAELAQLTRRLHIDLTGKIPTVSQLTEMIGPAKDSLAKLEDRIDDLLDSADYTANFASYWRTIVLRGINQQRGLSDQFDNWLRGYLKSNTSYDKIARDIINGQGKQNGPAAFKQFNQDKAENLAGATARAFLGIKMECAECHNHPFAEWSRGQFWEFAAFFAPEAGPGKKMKIPGSNDLVSAKFLTGEEPNWTATESARSTLADWVASPKNPYFAKASVDYVWQYFIGVSLVEPFFEPSELSPPPQPELLEELAKSFVDSTFDLKLLIRAIVLTDAYQRASVPMSEANKISIQMFAKMPARVMTPEQLFDCLTLATEYRNGPIVPLPPDKKKKNNQAGQVRNQFLELFWSEELMTETRRSVLQALYLMNGPFVTERTQQAATQIAGLPNASTQQGAEALYMMVLSRLPRRAELDKMVNYIDSSSDTRQALADMCWVLLNSSEFMLNH